MSKAAKMASMVVVAIVLCIGFASVLLDDTDHDRPELGRKVIKNEQQVKAPRSGKVKVYDPNNIIPLSSTTADANSTRKQSTKSPSQVQSPEREIGDNQVLIIVLDHEDQKLPGTAFKARSQEANLQDKFSNADGEVLFELSAGDSLYAQVWHPRYGSARAIGPIACGTVFELRFPSEAPCSLQIQCVDDSDQAVENAVVSITNTTVGIRTDLTQFSIVENRPGEYTATLGNGRVTLFAKREGLSQSNTAWVSPSPSTNKKIKLVLPRLGSLQGELIDLVGDGTEVILECDVTTGQRPYTRTETFEKTAELQGNSFELENLTPGEYKIRCFVKNDRGQGSEWQKLIIQSGELSQCDFVFKRLPLRCEGRIENDRGEAVVGARVMCHISSATTNEDGRFKFYGVPVGIQRITISAKGYATTAVSVAVIANKVEKHTIVLSSFGSSSGKVVDPNGVPLPGVRVNLIELIDGRSGNVQSVKCDKSGQFKFSEIRPGNYYYVVGSDDPDFTAEKVVIKVSPGHDSRLALTYEP